MQIKNTILTTILFVLFCGTVVGQTNRYFLVGIQPSITIEPFYEEGELDINVLPAVVEIPLGLRVNYRFVPTLNYHIGGTEGGISDVGFYSVFPVFIKKRESSGDKPYGFYVGPVLGLGRNLLNSHYTITLAAEPGYMFEAKKSFTIVLGLQLGSSYFAYDSQPNKWVFHWGPKVTFGFWINRKKNSG